MLSLLFLLFFLFAIIYLILNPAQINNVANLNIVLILIDLGMLIGVIATFLQKVENNPKSKLRKPLEECNNIINLLWYVYADFMTLALIFYFAYQTQLKELLIALGLYIGWSAFLRIVKKWNEEKQSSETETDKDENQTGGEI